MNIRLSSFIYDDVYLDIDFNYPKIIDDSKIDEILGLLDESVLTINYIKTFFKEGHYKSGL